MKLASVVLVVIVFCTGCGGDRAPSNSSVSEETPSTSVTEQSREYPKVEWSAPESDEANVVDSMMSAWPASIVGVRERFTNRNWTEASDPRFTIWLSENDFFRITIDADSMRMVGMLKTTEAAGNDELFPRVRMTQEFASEAEALSVLEAYLKQDGSFDSLVRWAA